MKYLKWFDTIIGYINDDNSVNFTKPCFNNVVRLYTSGTSYWSDIQFREFLADRIVSKDRRDIEKILFRCGISTYDVIKIAFITRAVNSKDLLWIAYNESEKFEDIITDIFSSVFINKIDAQGDSINTPDGYNIKRYGVFNGQYGIYKQRINPLVTDCESEVAVYLLAKELGINCCPAYFANKDTIFSVFKYDFSKEYIVHFRRLFGDFKRSENEYLNLIHIRPQYKENIIKMLLLDFITRQDDRHLSNIAVKVSEMGESFYDLYDNGRSLFYEDTEETVNNAINNIAGYSTAFGYEGTYFDILCDISNEHIDFEKLINLNIKKDKIAEILTTAQFKGYRFEGSINWIMQAVDILRDM